MSRKRTVGEIVREQSHNKYENSYDIKNVALVYFDPISANDTFQMRKLIESKFNTLFRDGTPYDYYGLAPEVTVVSTDELKNHYKDFDAIVMLTFGSMLQAKYRWITELGIPTFYWKEPDHTGFVETVTCNGKRASNFIGCFRNIGGAKLEPGEKSFKEWIFLPREPIKTAI